MTDMHISLLSAAIAGLIAIWLGVRCVRLRFSEKVIHGDGGSALLLRRMRAQSNFSEYTPVALILIVVLDLSDRDGWGLALAALAFMIGRILHATGMDADVANLPRQLGMLLTFPILAGLSIWATLVAFGIA